MKRTVIFLVSMTLLGGFALEASAHGEVDVVMNGFLKDFKAMNMDKNNLTQLKVDAVKMQEKIEKAQQLKLEGSHSSSQPLWQEGIKALSVANQQIIDSLNKGDEEGALAALKRENEVQKEYHKKFGV